MEKIGSELWEMSTLSEQKEGATFTDREVISKGCEHTVTEANANMGCSTISNDQKAQEDDVGEIEFDH